MNRKWITTVLALSGAVALVAQPPHGGPEMMMRHGGPGGPGGPPPFARDMRVVKGSPYAADVTSESTQVLSDGTKITKKTVGSVYRDGEGRTRREETNTEGRKTVNIFDPVAGVALNLNPTAKTGSKQQVHVPADRAAAAGRPAHGPGTAAVAGRAAHANGRTRVTEDLGTQAIEGVQAQGRRTTTTIAAGTMGNDREIKEVDEVWFSPDLQVVVQSHHSDPWSGDVTYKIANVRRADQPHTLFEAPADFAVSEGGHRRQGPPPPPPAAQ
jgi:hypothetical protein